MGQVKSCTKSTFLDLLEGNLGGLGEGMRIAECMLEDACSLGWRLITGTTMNAYNNPNLLFCLEGASPMTATGVELGNVVERDADRRVAGA